MWIVAGVLLGAVVLAALLGFHAGPHVHVAAGVLGVVAAVWLVVMAVAGRAVPVLWVLLGVDLAMSGGLGVLGWTGLRHRHDESRYRVGRLEAAEGVAVTDLVPEGVVRVRGEDWSAVSVNGPVRAGSRIQVLRDGVRLEVWGERTEEVPVGGDGGHELPGTQVGKDPAGGMPRAESRRRTEVRTESEERSA